MPRWIPVEERLPDLDEDVQVWGDCSEPGDPAVLARRCSCHNRWIGMGEAATLGEDYEALGDDQAEWLLRIVGTVTHYLDPHPLPGEEEPE